MKIVKRVGERLLPHWIRAEFAPLLAFTGAGASLAAGSRILVRRGWTELSDRLHGWELAAAPAGGLYVIVYGCAQAPDVAQFAIPGAAVAWCVAAWWIAPPGEREASAGPAEDVIPKPVHSDPQDVYAATLEWIRQQIGDRQGVHLRDLLAHAQVHGMFEDLDVTELRAHLERHRIPVRDRVRVRGLGVTVGIHRDDLQPLPEPLPDPESQDPPETELHPA